MKLKLIGLIAVLSVFLLIVGCTKEPSQAFIGSLDTEGFSLDAPVYEDLNGMVAASELIVVGKIKGEPEITHGDKMDTTIYTFSVDDTLKGDKVEEIKFFQLGVDGSDEYETKIKRNKTYVLFLTENYTRDTQAGESEVIYNSISFEQGIFEINGSGRLKSLTKIGVAPKMDNMNLTDLKGEIQTLSK